MTRPAALVEDDRPYRLYVLLGPYARLAESWARARGIDPARVMLVRGDASLPRLRRVDGRGVALVWFPVPPPPELERPAPLGRLLEQGAVDIPSTWHPMAGVA